NQKRRMHARPLISEKKDPGRGRFEDGHRMLALHFDITNLRTLRFGLWPQRRLPPLEGQRHQFVLIVQGVDQTTIRWRRRQEFLGPSVSRGEREDDQPRECNDGEASLDLVQSYSRSVRPF